MVPPMETGPESAAESAYPQIPDTLDALFDARGLPPLPTVASAAAHGPVLPVRVFSVGSRGSAVRSGPSPLHWAAAATCSKGLAAASLPIVVASTL